MWQFVYASNNNKFSILFDTEEKSLEFCYWRQYAGNRFLNEGDEFAAERDTREHNGIERGLLISKNSYIDKEDSLLDISKNREKSDQVKIIDNFSGCNIQEEIEKEKGKYKVLVFIGCSFDEDIELSSNFDKNKKPTNDFKCDVELAFLDCTFSKNLTLSAIFSSDIWIVDCNIKAQFSLKNSIINGDAHLESNCFDGEGGVSFRGVSANNLYIDLETVGSEDIFWFNELSVPGIVSIGGSFKSKIQILSDQFNPSKYKEGTEIGKLFIGLEYTDIDADRDNPMTSDAPIEIRGLKTQNISMFGVDAKSISISDLGCSGDVSLQDVSTNKDLEILRVNIKGADLIIDKSSIGRHMFIHDNKLPYIMTLSGTSVSEVSYIENNEFLPATSNINFSRFTTSKLLFSPVSDLYANKKNDFLKFKPHDFSLLLQDSNDLGDQYCSLKHWLSDSGRLKEEDMAYFHMNDCFSDNPIYTAIFGTIFGWGVRLTNILMSSLFIMLLFYVIYIWIGMTPMTSLTVTIQSFFGILLDPIFEIGAISNNQVFTQEVNWWVTAESVLGIFFITVLVGAYVRKMLR
jgi:hypothetical protein